MYCMYTIYAGNINQRRGACQICCNWVHVVCVCL